MVFDPADLKRAHDRWIAEEEIMIAVMVRYIVGARLPAQIRRACERIAPTPLEIDRRRDILAAIKRLPAP